MQTRYNKIAFTVLASLLSVLVLTPSVLHASHIVGGEITYKFVSRTAAPSNMITYHITLKVYRDLFSVNGTGLDANPAIGIYLQRPNNGAFALFRQKNVRLSSQRNVPPPNLPCSTVPPNIGVEEGIYEWDEVLKDTTGSYVIVYQRCCRNGTIANILNPGTTGASYYTEITPESQHSSNNSPVFREFPPILVCGGEPLNFDHGATDTEGDQLIYKFCNAYVGGSSNGPSPNPPTAPPYSLVTFRVPTYSFNAPMAGNPVVKIDPNTGRITGAPQTLGQFVVTICAEEFRNGQLIGRIFRDFQFNVVTCKKLIVTAITADSTQNTPLGKAFFIKGCENVSFTINNQSYDRANVTNFYWEFKIGSDTIRYTDWSPMITFRDTGLYRGKLLLNPGTPCGDSAFVTVSVGGKIYPNFTLKYDTCVAGDVSFKSITTSSIPLKTLIWNYGDMSGDTNKVNTTHLYATPGTKNVKLNVKDIYGCVGDTTISFNWQPAPPILIVEPDNFTGCAPAKVTFYNRSSPLDTTYNIVWTFGDGTRGGGVSPVHIYAVPDTYSVKLQVTSPIGCYKEASFKSWIKVKSLPKANFDWTPKILNNLRPAVSFIDSSSSDVVGWRWYFSEKAYSNLKNPPFVYKDTGVQTIKLYVINANGCRDSIVKKLYIEPEMTFFMPNAFSPNYDSMNDVFKGNGFLYGLKSFNMSVWNRWGEKIFETLDPHEGWNGQKNNVGEPAQEGVYLYEVRYITPKNEVKIIRDFLTLYR